MDMKSNGGGGGGRGEEDKIGEDGRGQVGTEFYHNKLCIIVQHVVRCLSKR